METYNFYVVFATVPRQDSKFHLFSLRFYCRSTLLGLEKQKSGLGILLWNLGKD
jgi:hypothetical protein